MEQRPFGFIKSATGKKLLIAATSAAILTSTITSTFAATPAQELASAFPTGVNPSTATLVQVEAALHAAIIKYPADGAALLASAIALRPAKSVSGDTVALLATASTALKSVTQPIVGATTVQQLNNELVILKVNPPVAKAADIQNALSAALAIYPSNVLPLVNQAISILPASDVAVEVPMLVTTTLAAKSLQPLTINLIKNVTVQAAISLKTVAPTLPAPTLDIALADIANNGIVATKIMGTTVPNPTLVSIINGVATAKGGFSSDQDAILFARAITVLNVANASAAADAIEPLISTKTSVKNLAASLSAVAPCGEITDKVRFDIAYGLTLADSKDAASIAAGVASKLGGSIANYSTLANSVISALGSNVTSTQVASIVDVFLTGTPPYVPADLKNATLTTFAANIASANPAAGLVVAETVANTFKAGSDYAAFAAQIAYAAFDSKTPLTGSKLDNELAAIAVEVARVAYAHNASASTIANLVADVIRVNPASTYQIVGQVLSEVNFSASDLTAITNDLKTDEKTASPTVKNNLANAILAAANHSSDFNVSNWPMQPPPASF